MIPYALPDSLPASGVWHPLEVSVPEQGPIPQPHLSQYTVGPVPFTAGLAPAERAGLPGYDTGVLCLLIGMFLILAANFRHYSTFFKNFISDLFSVRRREADFSVRTFSETGVQASVIMIACLCQAIIINSILPDFPDLPYISSDFFIIGSLTLLGILYYFWQLAAYASVGAVFTDRVSARLWLKGFNASQALLAMLVVVPALIVLFNPETSGVIITLGILSYFIARLIFISKGFRLFYDNFGSLVYFILYLCSLEIVPLVLLYRTVMSCNRFLLQT